MIPRWVGYAVFMAGVATATFVILEILFGGRW
jgi:hypothetical protein